MKNLILDFETRSTVDIKRVGAWAYARHPETQVLCVSTWLEGESQPRIFKKDAIREAGKYVSRVLDKDAVRIVAHNAHFEYAIWNYCCAQKYGWEVLGAPIYWSCTLARAAMCGLPIGLGALAEALRLPTKKDLAGRAATQKLCKPRPDGSWCEDPAVYDALYDYCIQDVAVEMSVHKTLPDFVPHERAIWEADLVINRRGVQVDVELAAKAEKIAEDVKARMAKRLEVLTGGFVDTATRVARLREWLASKGVEAESLDKQTVTALLENPAQSAEVREVLQIRRQAGKSSTAKFTATVEAADEIDGRVRGALQYHAAATGRWGGRLIQPQNYPKGFNKKDQAAAITAILETPELFDLYYQDPMTALSNTLRGTITAKPGHRLIVADFNAIEARVLFWLAGDTDALGLYARGESPYIDMAQYIYGNPEITKETHPVEYDLGKRAVLGCGYQMGAPKFHATVLAQTGKSIPMELAARAVKAYREKYPKIPALWREVERAAIAAVRTPGTVHTCCGGRVRYAVVGDFLLCQLPSGRYLRYYRPYLATVQTPWGDARQQVGYWAVDSTTKQFSQQHAYGGMLVENITQGVARDLLAHGMLNCEAAEYPIVLTVHDELVAEVRADDETKTVDDFMSRMCNTPEWAKGCPVKAEGWTRERYGK